MQDHWNDDQPIYRQLRDKIVDLMLEGVFAEGDSVPSVRQVAAQYNINHLTVSKAYQELVDDGLLFKKRGVGMFVADGARDQLLTKQREKFVQEELPLMLAKAKQLGIPTRQLIKLITAQSKDNV